MPRLPSPRALAFDLDGTLVDSRLDIAAACNHTLAWAGRSPLAEDVIATFVGDGARTLLARAFGLDRTSPELDAPLAEFVRWYAAHPVVHTRWMTGAIEALDGLAHLPIALVTNKARAVTIPILDALGVRSRFAFVVAGGDGPLKPSPEPLFAIGRALSIEPRDIWSIGDATQDIGMARAAGSVAIAVLGGFHAEERLREAQPDVVIHSLLELGDLIAQGAS
jgi:phosphoglycolate phosphatase